MLGNILMLLLFIVITVLLIWAAVRIWRSRSKLAKFGGGILTSLLAIIMLAVTALTARGMSILNYPQRVQDLPITVEYTPEQITRGQHLADTLCSSCHSTTGETPLSGGFNLADDIGMPIGDMYPPNITPAGEVAQWTDSQIFTFFRTGHKPDGRWTVMPMGTIGNLSDDDLKAVIAYLRSQEPVQNQTKPLRASLLGFILIGSDLLKVPMEAKPFSITAPPKGPTSQYGEYIVSYNDCIICHGAKLDGVVSGPVPAGPSLAAVKGWTAEQFISTMRTGVDPSGRPLMPPMPWKQIGKMDDIELTALFEYLKTYQGNAAVQADQ